MKVIKELRKEGRNLLEIESYLVPTARFELLTGAKRADRILYQIEQGVEFLIRQKNTSELVEELASVFKERTGEYPRAYIEYKSSPKAL